MNEYPYLFWSPNGILCEDLIDEILSYGDIFVTQNYEKVLGQIKNLKYRFDMSAENPDSLWFHSPERFFYYFCLRDSYIQRKNKNPYKDFSKYLSTKITDENLIWVGQNYSSYFPLLRNPGFWYDTFPYEGIVDLNIEIDDY